MKSIAVVAGGSRGLGLLIASELGRRGHRVVICARTEVELERAAEGLRGDGHRVDTRVCDVADHDAVEAMIDGIEHDLGQIEVLICVAGIIQVGPLAALDRDAFEAAVATMLWGPINLGLAVAPRMTTRGRGRLGMITSVGGLISAPHLLPYSTAKFGAVGFSRGLRSELIEHGVTVTTVTPGLMRTGSHLRAQFVGDHAAEFAWFATAASMPLLSIDAERAARRIVHGVLSGRANVVLTPLAVVAPVVAAVSPRFTAALLSAVHRLLPAAPSTETKQPTLPGWQASALLGPRSRRVVDRLTTLGRSAARRLNQQPHDDHDGATAS